MPSPKTPIVKALTSQQHDLLRWMEQQYLIHGHLPTKALTVEKSLASGPYYDKCLSDPSFRNALLVRGISLRGHDGTDNGVLTAEQLRVANIMLDLRDNRSQKNKLKDCNVPTQRWEAWLREPAFQSYLRSRAEAALGDNLHESHLALVERVRSGDVSAIKYFNEITGRYVPNATDKVDVNAVLMRVLEIIQHRVRDPLIASAIADDLLQLSTLDRGMLAANNPSVKLIESKAISAGIISESEEVSEPITSL